MNTLLAVNTYQGKHIYNIKKCLKVNFVYSNQYAFSVLTYYDG